MSNSFPNASDFPDWMVELSQFQNHMESHILLNAHKGMREAWLQYPLEKILIYLEVSLAELRTALAYGIDVEDKAVDVANYAFICQDVFVNAHPEVPASERFSGD